MPTLINEIPKVFLYGETLESEELNEIIDQINSAIRKLNNIENNLVNHGYSSIPITNIYCRTKKGINAINFFPLVDDKRNELLNLVSNCNSTQGIKYNINFSTVTISEDKDLMNGVWTAYPQGISASLPHEWEVSYKKLEDNSIIYVSGPVLYSNYGYNGTDGDSVQYIYKIFDHKLSGTEEEENTPFKPENPNSDGEYIPSGWKDNPQGPTREYPFEYVAILKKIKGNWEEKFEKISLWSTFSESGDFLTRVFCRYTPTQNKPAPNTPIGGTYNNPLPESNDNIQWSLTIPAEDDNNKGPIWTSVRIFKGTNEITEWSTPVIEADSAEIDIEYSSTMERPLLSTLRNIPNTAHPSNNIWHDPSETNIDLSTMVWRAERKIKNGQYIGNWVITKITGLRGDFKSFVFRRFKPTLEQLIPPTPTGGTYDNPIPDGGLWSDGLPPGNTSDGLIWTSSRTFTDNGIQSAWSTPRVLSDNDTLDIEFSPGIGSDHTLPNNPEGPPFTNREDSGWYDPSSINFSLAGTMFWRAERKVQNGQYLGGWVVTRIIGENGTDGNGFEYIFKGFRTEQTSWNTDSDDYPPKWINSDISAFREDDYLGPSGHLWADNAIGVNDTDNRFVYVCSRKKYVDEGASKATWHAFSVPKLWSQYVTSGPDGIRGTYTLFIFKTTSIDLSNSSNYTELSTSDSSIPSGWSETATNPSSSSEYIWGSHRLISFDEDNEEVYGNWQAPYKISGIDGPLGGHYEFRYKNANSQPSAPTGTGNTDGWSSIPSDTTSSAKYTWMSQSYVNSDNLYGTWTTPIRITGPDGEKGADGTDIEFIYTTNNTGVAPSAPATSLTDDYIPTGWTDNPLGVSSSNMYEYISTRSKTNGTWSNFSIPVVWSKWGEKGQDGDGYEYIFKLTTDTTAPSTPSNSPQTDNYVPTGWNADPSSVSTSFPYQWCSVRKKISGTWGSWSTPALWSKLGEKGETGGHYEFRYKNASSLPSAPTGTGFTNGWSNTPSDPNVSGGEYTWMSQCYVTPSASGDSYGTWSTPIRITGGKGDKGADGTDIEFIYTRNNTGTAPSAPATTQTNDWYGTDGNGVTWTDNPQGVQSNLMYEYVSVRYKNNGVWGAYSTPVVWSKWGEKGLDGDGYEYIYKATSSSSSPGNPTPNDTSSSTYQTNGYVPTGWHGEPTSLDSTNAYLWTCVRKKTNEVWGSFSNPALWSHYDSSTATTPTVVYQLVATASAIKYKKNHASVIVWTPDQITLQLFKFEGNTFEEQTTLPSGWSILRTIDGTNTSSTGLLLRTAIDIIRLTTYDNNGTSVIGSNVSIKALDAGNNVKAILNLSIIREYLRMLIPAGAYTDKLYSITDTTVPLVLGSDKNYYYLIADTNRVNGTNIDPTTANQTVWGKADEYEVILTKALFADFAKLGSFVVYDKYFFSLFGYLYDSSGNVTYINSSSAAPAAYEYFDPNDPMAEITPSNWSLNGWNKSYKFKPVRGINAETGEDWGAAGNLHMEPLGDVYVNGTIVSQGTSNSRWEISPEVYNSVAIPRIVGYSTNGNEKIVLIFDADDSDSYNVLYGGGLSFIRQELGTNVMAGGYFLNKWEVQCSDYGKTDQNTNTTRYSYISCLPEYSNPRLYLYDNFNGNTKSLSVAVNYQGAYLQSSNWMSKINATNGCTYVDDWGNVKVKNSLSYDQFNIRTSSFTLPLGAPVGTVFFCKGFDSDMTVTTSGWDVIMNPDNRGTTQSMPFYDKSVFFVKMAQNKWVTFWSE